MNIVRNLMFPALDTKIPKDFTIDKSTPMLARRITGGSFCSCLQVRCILSLSS